jgi:MFS family permease
MGVGYWTLGGAGGLAGALVGSALVGLGTAAWHPPAMGALSVRFPDRRATVLAIHGTGATVADTLTPLALGALLVAFSWPDVLRAQALPAAAVALLMWRGLAGQFPDRARPPAREVGAVLLNPGFVVASVVQGLMMMARQVILTFLPLYVQIGLRRDAFELGVYIALLHGMGTVSQPVLGVLSDRLGRRTVLVPAYLTVAALYVLLARVQPGWPLAAVVLALGLFFYTLTNVSSAAVFDAAGSGVQASAMGLASVVTQALVLPAPVLGGWIVERHGYESAFFLAAGLMAAGALIMIPRRFRRERAGTAGAPSP